MSTFQRPGCNHLVGLLVQTINTTFQDYDMNSENPEQ